MKDYCFQKVNIIKKAVLELATKGITYQTPDSFIKDPMVVEFIGIPEDKPMLESDLERALIDHIEDFLLELGRLVSRSDGTQITYADAFIGNPTRIIMPGKTMNLTWNGCRLKSINSDPYSYNQDGIRIGKTVSGSYNEKYYLEGDRIASLKRQQGTNVERLGFVYDEAQMSVGLSYNGNEYFYDRSVDGKINILLN